jgi:hypothetical protein
MATDIPADPARISLRWLNHFERLVLLYVPAAGTLKEIQRSQAESYCRSYLIQNSEKHDILF